MARINNKIYALLAASAIGISALEITCAANRQSETAQSKLQQIRQAIPSSVYAKSGEMIRRYSKVEVRKCTKGDQVLFEVASGNFDLSLSHSEYAGFTEQGEYLFSSSVTDGSKELGMPLASQGYICDVLFAESGIH